jgi:hypothetical protein
MIEPTPRGMLVALRIKQSRWDDTILEFNEMNTRDKLELLFRMMVSIGGDIAEIQEQLDD